MINVFIVDDHPAIVDAIKSYLKYDAEITVVGEANNGEDAISSSELKEVDVLLLDYSMPGIDGLQVCEYIEETYPEIKTIVITSYKDAPLIKKFIDIGAVGYLTKDATKNEYINAIKDVVLGGKVYSHIVREVLLKCRGCNEKFEPTKLEIEVLKHIINGKNSDEIAEILHRSHFTIEERRKKMLERFRIHEGDDKNMSSLIYYVAKHGLL